MQILEVTGYAIRSAAVTLRRPETPMTFALFPMMHFAAPSFYKEVRRRMRSCELIVAEGIEDGGHTLQSNAMAFSNRYYLTRLSLIAGSDAARNRSRSASSTARRTCQPWRMV